MTGTNRDELAIDMDMPKDDANITKIFAEQLPGGVGDLSRFVRAPEFSINNRPTPERILNVSVRIATDGLYTCLEQATARSASQHGIFSAIYSFQFNRTYNPSGYTKPHCNAPKTDSRPNGDPDQEYFKCHAGEQMIVFGTVRRDGLPDRDGLDVPFMQLIVDYWSSFARTRNPNPSREYLVARGYWSTLAQTEAMGPWYDQKLMAFLRLLQWNGRHVPLTEQEQCEVLGLPPDYFEKH
jgi:hypothetical protein